MPKIAIIGNGSWGTALGIILARKGIYVRLWTRDQEKAKKLNEVRENVTHLPGFRFPARLSVTGSLEEAMNTTEMVILAVPAQSMRHNIREVKNYLNESKLIVSATKGLEIGSGKRMSEVIAEEIDPRFHPNICVLSGPNIAREAAQGLLSATVIATPNVAMAERAQRLINSNTFYVFTSTDVIGTELGGALKNVIALGAGITDGFGYGNNAKAALIIRGLSEIILLGTRLGANPLTFIGLSALGDLLVTCFSPLSRNYSLGKELTNGRPSKEILNTTNHVAEGVTTAAAALELGRKVGVNLPLTEQIYKVIYEGLDVREAATKLVEYPVEREPLEITKLLRLIVQYVNARWQPQSVDPLSLWEEDSLPQS
ncbi:MAG TPA: NAD(P)H-dependent glycerol-3-phosphate dehydrogenase [Dehalococcoidia bacterium]|nr:NAD(P)H-dependent glycerol-3-phosphate dehydrogenase [Dehalococcoidia bacterium]